MRIGILGATGPAGRGLAARLGSVGHEVLFGSREREKAERSVGELRARWDDRVAGLLPVDNAGACDAPVVVLAVQAGAAIPSIEQHARRLRGKIVVSMANDLARRGDEFHAVLPPHGSVAAEIQARAADARIVSAFHLVPAAEFADLDRDMESDVVACGDDDDARATVMEIIRGIPHLRAFDGGSLANAVGMEAFAAVLLTINLRHRCRASLRLAGV
jgi:NADPH-dependent F420 reductase